MVRIPLELLMQFYTLGSYGNEHNREAEQHLFIYTGPSSDIQLTIRIIFCPFSISDLFLLKFIRLKTNKQKKNSLIQIELYQYDLSQLYRELR